MIMILLFFFKQKTAYDVRISDWSSDVCSSDLVGVGLRFLDARIARDHEVGRRAPAFEFEKERGAVDTDAIGQDDGLWRIDTDIIERTCGNGAGLGRDGGEIAHGDLPMGLSRDFARSPLLSEESSVVEESVGRCRLGVGPDN